MADKGLDLEQVGVLVDRKIRTAVGVSTSKLSKEREMVTRYRNGEYPKRQHSGQASYVSTDVYDAVEAMKADLLETFGGSQEIVKFNPQGPEDVEPCRIATEYCSYVFYRQNPGFRILHDVVEDGLTARIGVVKVFWDPDTEEQEEEFDGLDEETVQGLAAQDDIPELDAQLQPDGTYAGRLTRTKANRSQVRVDPVSPENFGIEPHAKSLDGYFHYHRELMTRDEIARMGWNVKLLKDLKPDADEHDEADTETEARFNPVDSGYSPNEDADNETGKFKVYECYVNLSKEGRTRLYKVVQVANVVLACDEVDRSPFKVFVPLRTSHSFWGNNFAARVIPTQNARTVLTRGILDHTSITNNPRYTVLQGGLTNPREMLDNRLGGLVNITRPDAVQPLMQASLNPFVFNTLEMLKMNAEQTTGISSLSQGLNKDAISSQNSHGMVADLVDLSKQRAKVVARNLAEFMAEVYVEIYRLVLENEERKSIVEVAGKWVDIDPSTWIERKDFTISFHLGQAAADAEAMKFTQLLALGAQDPDLARMLQPKNKYNVASHVMRLKGVKNIDDFITPPEQLTPPEPDPMLLKKMELEERAVAVSELTAQAQMMKVQVAAQMQEAELMLKKMAQDFDHFMKQREADRKDADIANKIDVAQRELAIVEKEPDTDPVKAIVSPNS